MIPFVLGMITGFLAAVLLMVIYAVAITEVKKMKLVIDIDDEQVLFDIKNQGLEAETDTDKVIINALYNGIPLKTGKWIEVEVRNVYATLKCSVCGRVIEPFFDFCKYSYEDIKRSYPYCHCGAYMGGADETN